MNNIENYKEISRKINKSFSNYDSKNIINFIIFIFFYIVSYFLSNLNLTVIDEHNLFIEREALAPLLNHFMLDILFLFNLLLNNILLALLLIPYFIISSTVFKKINFTFLVTLFLFLYFFIICSILSFALDSNQTFILNSENTIFNTLNLYNKEIHNIKTNWSFIIFFLVSYSLSFIYLKFISNIEEIDYFFLKQERETVKNNILHNNDDIILVLNDPYFESHTLRAECVSLIKARYNPIDTFINSQNKNENNLLVIND